jgi:hypothetical protein
VTSTLPRAPTRERSHARRLLDIEDALQWAYREELPKGREGEGGGVASMVSPMFRLVTFGGRVDNWSREPGFPAAMGDPHPDALTIARAVTVVQASIGADPELAPDLGFADLDEQLAIKNMLPQMTGLVMVNAKLASRPSWGGEPTPGPACGANGKPRVLRAVTRMQEGPCGPVPLEVLEPTGATRKGTYPDGAFSPLAWDPPPFSLVVERAEYAVWWAALDALARDLAGKLESIGVLPPSAPRRPWAGDRELGNPKHLFREDGHAALHRPAKRDPVYAGARRSLPRAGEVRRVNPSDWARAHKASA